MTAQTATLALRAAIARLSEAGIADAPRDARHLLAFAMGLAADRVTLHLADPLTEAQQAGFAAAITARATHQPVAQITGQRQFWGRIFRVTPDVLDPRPETETLVQAALAQPFTQILDLGTGSGCILLSCLADRPKALGVGADISSAALAVAQSNAVALGVADRARFVLSDWTDAVTGRYDMIVANPPYIAAAEMATLAPDVRNFEPHLALTPGGDGLSPYRTIARNAPALMLPEGWLLVEIGPTQGAAVRGFFAEAGLQNLLILQDIDGRDRVVAAQKD